MAIEVEIRSFLSKEKYEKLLGYFQKHGELAGTEDEETEYYADQGAVRLRQSQDSAKIILKTGNIHDESREEHEIPIEKDHFPLFQKMFKKISVPKQIKWKRIKHTFNWEDITVELAHTKGYRYIIELEKITDETRKEQALALLKQKMSELEIPITPKEEFEKAYNDYKENWKSLLEEE